MTKSKILLAVLVGLVTLTMFSSCNKDDRTQVSQVETENRTWQEGQMLTNEQVTKIISIMVCDPVFKQMFTNSVNTSQTSSSQSVTFMELLTGPNTSTFCQKFTQACGQLGVADGLSNFINGNLAATPNLCLSLHKADEPPSQNQVNPNLPVFSEQLFDAIPDNQNYVFYSCGNLNSSLTSQEEPKFDVCVIQERAGFVSMIATQIANESYFNTHSKVKYLQSLVNGTNFQFLNYNPSVSNSTLNLCGTQYTNPFVNRYFLNDSIMTTLYNNAASSAFYFPPAFPPNGNFLCSNGLASQRTTFNTTINVEFSHSIKLPLGNDVLELNKSWCAWWNPNCRFMVDLYVPSKFNSATFEPLTLTKFFWYDEDDLKDKDFVTPEAPAEFIPWFFEEGSHGNEWKYNWTGKHRKEGQTTEFTLGAQLGAAMKFKDPILGAETTLSPSVSATYKTTRTNKDLFLGGDLVYWCDEILVNANRGHQYSTGDVVFHIREKQ